MPSEHKPLSAKEIAEALALCEKATPGPWRAYSRHTHNQPANDPAFGEQSGLGWDIEGPPEPQLRGQFSSGYDAAFIAAARTGWTRALADLKDAWNSVPESLPLPGESLAKVINVLVNRLQEQWDRRVKAEADLERARKVLAEVHRRVVTDYRTGSAPTSPRWWGCRICGRSWEDGAAELHGEECPLNAYLAGAEEGE